VGKKANTTKKKAPKKKTPKNAASKKKASKKAAPKKKAESKATRKPAPGRKPKAKPAFPKPEGGQKLRNRIGRIHTAIEPLYASRGTALHFKNPFQLIVATVLSAQSTDEQVNKATPALFDAYPTPEALADAPTEHVERLVHSTGFYRQKTKSIQSLARDLVERFASKVPREMDELTSLRGVGRKTANCVRSQAYGVPGIIVDTHFKRLALRMGLVDTTDPEKIEAQVCTILPEEHWTALSNEFIWHGRATCDARKPDCPNCSVLKDCPWGQAAVKLGP